MDYGELVRKLGSLVQPVGDVIPFRRQSIEPGMGVTEGARPNMGGGEVNARGGIGKLPPGYDPVTGEIKIQGPVRTLQQSRKEYRQGLSPEQQMVGFMEESLSKGIRANHFNSDVGKYWLAQQRQRWLNGLDIEPPPGYKFD